jgi:hypothetical protein
VPIHFLVIAQPYSALPGRKLFPDRRPFFGGTIFYAKNVMANKGKKMVGSYST